MVSGRVQTTRIRNNKLAKQQKERARKSKRKMKKAVEQGYLKLS